MPQIPKPSDLIQCSNLSSCFQALYNFLFAIFVAMAFLFFLYGAFQYLLSGAGIFQKEAGKNKMKNSIIALIVVLVMPVILNMINPGIFRATLSIPQIISIVSPQIYIEIVQKSEKFSTNINNSGAYLQPTTMAVTISQSSCIVPIEHPDTCPSRLPPDNWKWDIAYLNSSAAFGVPYEEIMSIFQPPGYGIYLNPQLMPTVIALNYRWQELCAQYYQQQPGVVRPQKCPVALLVTDGFNTCGHPDWHHTCFGTALDIIVVDNYTTQGSSIVSYRPVNPDNPMWGLAIQAARDVGFYVLDERKNVLGIAQWTGAHLHLRVDVQQ